MVQNSRTVGQSGISPTSKMSFAVAGCAFVAAAIGLLVNQWMSGWMAVGGMAGLGLFYLAIGVLSLGSSSGVFLKDHDLIETAAHRLSGVANVDDEAIERTLDAAGETQNGNLTSVRT